MHGREILDHICSVLGLGCVVDLIWPRHIMSVMWSTFVGVVSSSVAAAAASVMFMHERVAWLADKVGHVVTDSMNSNSSSSKRVRLVL